MGQARELMQAQGRAYARTWEQSKIQRRKDVLTQGGSWTGRKRYPWKAEGRADTGTQVDRAGRRTESGARANWRRDATGRGGRENRVGHKGELTQGRNGTGRASELSWGQGLTDAGTQLGEQDEPGAALRLDRAPDAPGRAQKCKKG